MPAHGRNLRATPEDLETALQVYEEPPQQFITEELDDFFK